MKGFSFGEHIREQIMVGQEKTSLPYLIQALGCQVKRWYRTQTMICFVLVLQFWLMAGF
jgi:hypothetical protein